MMKQASGGKPAKKRWKAISGACIAIMAFAMLRLTLWSGNGNTAVYNELRKAAAPVSTTVIRFSPTLTPTPTFTPTPTLAPTPTPTPVDDGIRPSDRTIDFEALFERNPDIIGWLSVPGTEIDYPLLKSADNAEYLEYDVDGDENVAGAIFMDMGNDSGFSDRNTVIYGHNMKNGTMFAGLHQFEDKEFFYKNREIKLYTPAGMRTYEVIAAYPVSNRNILYGMDYADDDVWEAYVEDIYGNKDRSANLLKKQIGEHDQIVSLSTCVRGESKQRYLVQGLLRRDSD